MSKCLVLFVEGDTEVEFYKQVVANARKLHPAGRFDTNIEYRNVGGVGGFKSIALRKFKKEIKTKYEDDCVFTIVLCSDTDVFDFAPRPPIKWDEVKKELKESGASKIIHVQAKRSIEDWFLYDMEGMASNEVGCVLARLRKSPTKRIAMVLWKYRNSWNWRYHFSNKIDEVTLLLLMLLPSGNIDFTGLFIKGNKSNKEIEK